MRVVAPEHENKAGWDLTGQTIELRLSLTGPVSALKEASCTAVGGLPANKQNLKVEGLPYLKDKETLASYNLEAGVEIQLTVKERGKRRK